MGRRRDRLNKRLANQIVTRRHNSLVKAAQADRREQSMLTVMRAGQLPYTAGVMSWLSDKLGKKASRITQQDVEQVLAQA